MDYVEEGFLEVLQVCFCEAVGDATVEEHQLWGAPVPYLILDQDVARVEVAMNKVVYEELGCEGILLFLPTQRPNPIFIF